MVPTQRTVIAGQLQRARLFLPDERTALRRRARGRVRDREEREHRAKHDRRRPRALDGPRRIPPERVARLVRVVAHRGHDEVRAVRGDHAGLREPRARVVLLHGRVHAQDRDEHAEREVEGDEELVERAAVAGEERVEHARERDRRGVRAGRRADQDPLPRVRARRRVLPFVEARFGPRVSEVDEEDEAEEDEERRANERDVVAPEHEEAIRDEEGSGDEDEPKQDLRAPPAVLNCGTFVLCIPHSDKRKGEDKVQEGEGEAYTVDLRPSISH